MSKTSAHRTICEPRLMTSLRVTSPCSIQCRGVAPLRCDLRCSLNFTTRFCVIFLCYFCLFFVAGPHQAPRSHVVRFRREPLIDDSNQEVSSAQHIDLTLSLPKLLPRSISSTILASKYFSAAATSSVETCNFFPSAH